MLNPDIPIFENIDDPAKLADHTIFHSVCKCMLKNWRARSGLVIESLSVDRGIAGWSLTGVIALCP